LPKQIEIGTIPLPKSSNPKRIEENFKIFDFKLDAEDHAVLDSYNTGERLIPMTHAIKSKNYPFSIEFWAEMLEEYLIFYLALILW